MQKITPFLWFDSQAEEAAQYYIDVFSKVRGYGSNSKIVDVLYYERKVLSR